MAQNMEYIEQEVKKWSMVEHLQNCFIKNDSKLPDDVLMLHGMSTPNIRNLLNNIVSMDGARYLEVGVWKGATFVSALYGNTPDYACAVDNWSENSKPAFDANVARYITTEFSVLTGDSFNVNPEKGINIYFYDASHKKEAQYKALEYYYPYLADEFIFIADDYNFEPARIGTQNAIRELRLKILFNKRIGEAPYNEKATSEWWLGLYVAVLSK